MKFPVILYVSSFAEFRMHKLHWSIWQKMHEKKFSPEGGGGKGPHEKKWHWGQEISELNTFGVTNILPSISSGGEGKCSRDHIFFEGDIPRQMSYIPLQVLTLTFIRRLLKFFWQSPLSAHESQLPVFFIL